MDDNIRRMTPDEASQSHAAFLAEMGTNHGQIDVEYITMESEQVCGRWPCKLVRSSNITVPRVLFETPEGDMLLCDYQGRERGRWRNG